MGRAALVLALLPAAAATAQAVNDYPTPARAEYVMACMAANGRGPDALDRCSCAIDTVASILPYDGYVAAETVLRMRQTSGEQAGLFRSGAAADGPVAALRRAEAEAQVLCF